jgi:hypothetical protein
MPRVSRKRQKEKTMTKEKETWWDVQTGKRTFFRVPGTRPVYAADGRVIFENGAGLVTAMFAPGTWLAVFHYDGISRGLLRWGGNK